MCNLLQVANASSKHLGRSFIIRIENLVPQGILLKSTLFSMNISDGNAYETGDPLTL
jgi:hypothetical protein